MFKAMKFRVNNPEHSERLQKILFDLGYCWNDGDKIPKLSLLSFIYTDTHGIVTVGWLESGFEHDRRPEVDVSWLESKQDEVIKVGGKTYYKKDVEERLGELEPLEQRND